MPDIDDVFDALGDATRREVLRRLAEQGPQTPTELADVLPVTRQAVSKHLDVLGRAGRGWNATFHRRWPLVRIDHVLASPAAAELVKCCHNIFNATKISFWNEMWMVSQRLGVPGDEIAAYAKKNLDVLLVGSHGYGGFKSAVLGSVATRIAARCETPLLIVRA